MIPYVIDGSTCNAHVYSSLADLEPGAHTQIMNTISLAQAVHMAVMPDVHQGYSVPIGAVVALKGAASPGAVGYDQGCGMGAFPLGIKFQDLPDYENYMITLRPLWEALDRAIPSGFSMHEHPVFARSSEMSRLMDQFTSLAPEVQGEAQRAARQAGTLGSSNHYAELHRDENDNLWLTLHSGSRRIGHSLATVHIQKAMSLMHNQALPDPELAVFLAGTPEMEAYKRDLTWASSYAFAQRQLIADLAIGVIERFLDRKLTIGTPILCHHNYLAEEIHFGETLWITRKGAIRADKGRMGIIPGSMGTESFIVRGLGDPTSLMSAPHGAGRLMSRGEASRTFTVANLAEQMAGVVGYVGEEVLDEAPRAYKPIRDVIANASSLVEVVHTLGPKPLLTLKGRDPTRAQEKAAKKARREAVAKT